MYIYICIYIYIYVHLSSHGQPAELKKKHGSSSLGRDGGREHEELGLATETHWLRKQAQHNCFVISIYVDVYVYIVLLCWLNTSYNITEEYIYQKMQISVCMHIYIYNHYPFSGGTMPKCKIHVSRCFWGGPWKCKFMHMLQVFLKPSPQKHHLGDVPRPILNLGEDSPPKMYLTFWYGPP